MNTHEFLNIYLQCTVFSVHKFYFKQIFKTNKLAIYYNLKQYIIQSTVYTDNKVWIYLSIFKNIKLIKPSRLSKICQFNSYNKLMYRTATSKKGKLIRRHVQI